jgi:hypothetical protein
VGGAFLVLAGLAAWRGHSLQARAFAATGGVLVAAALAVPRRLGPIQRFWMALAMAISSVTTPVLMGIIYFLIVTPTGWVRRLAGGNRLTRARNATSFWVDRRPQSGRPVDMERLF